MWDLAKTGGKERYKCGGRKRATLCVRADWTQDSRANLEVMVEKLKLETVLQNLPYPFSVIGDNKVHNECAGNICHNIFAEEAFLLRLQPWQCWSLITGRMPTMRSTYLFLTGTISINLMSSEVGAAKSNEFADIEDNEFT